MKVLLVSGGDDYMATTFEQDWEETPEQMWDKANKQPNKTLWDDDGYIEFTAYEFGAVDEKFIEFIRSQIQDYDDSKTTNFYVIKENK